MFHSYVSLPEGNSQKFHVFPTLDPWYSPCPSYASLVLEGAQGRVGVVGPVSPGASWLTQGIEPKKPQQTTMYKYISCWWCNKHLEKYKSQWEGLSHILWKIKNVWNHQPYIYIHVICIWINIKYDLNMSKIWDTSYVMIFFGYVQSKMNIWQTYTGGARIIEQN